jgi:adenylate kinase
VLVGRLAGRWICRSCQTPYHEITAPPNQACVCDKDGGELYQRDDDKPEVVRARLQTYETLTAPLIDYYEGQGKLVRVNGQQDVEKVTADLLAAVSSIAVS